MHDCGTASEVCKSADVLHGIKWTAVASNDIAKSTFVKCFIKAGVLKCEGGTNAAEVADSNFDPFAELYSDINIVEELAKETTGTNVVSIKETVNGYFDPLICQELADDWEDSFFFENYARVTLMSQTTTTLMGILMMRFRNFLQIGCNAGLARQKFLIFFKILTLKDNRLNLQYSTHTFKKKQGLCPLQLCLGFVFNTVMFIFP